MLEQIVHQKTGNLTANINTVLSIVTAYYTRNNRLLLEHVSVVNFIAFEPIHYQIHTLANSQ